MKHCLVASRVVEKMCKNVKKNNRKEWLSKNKQKKKKKKKKKKKQAIGRYNIKRVLVGTKRENERKKEQKKKKKKNF